MRESEREKMSENKSVSPSILVCIFSVAWLRDTPFIVYFEQKDRRVGGWVLCLEISLLQE
jgi:hypothetical protein